tara:strand:+ start:6932 stop:7354 length:423 start_codon:yes stop_codon:yes gene_type:complete
MSALAAGAAMRGKGSLNLEGFTGTKTGLAGMAEKMKYSQAQKAAGQGGVAGAGGSMADGAAGGSMADGAVGSVDAGGSTMGVAPAVGAGAGADPSGADQFAGKKFEISPVQMKGSFSEKAKGDAEGVFGNEKDRNNSLKR